MKPDEEDYEHEADWPVPLTKSDEEEDDADEDVIPGTSSFESEEKYLTDHSYLRKKLSHQHESDAWLS